MKNTESRVEQVRHTINDLIQVATTYDTDALDRIYHDDMSVLMVDADHNVNTADKQSFTDIFRQKRDAGDPPMNTWAKFHNIDVKGNVAHALLSRKNDLGGQPMDLLLSIDLKHIENRWQVTREVIFLRPDVG